MSMTAQSLIYFVIYNVVAVFCLIKGKKYFSKEKYAIYITYAIVLEAIAIYIFLA